MLDFEHLISEGEYVQAAKGLDEELAKKESDKLYYLRAIVSYKLKNYEYAEEMLEHALYIRKDSDYLKLQALVLMETLEFGEALAALRKLLAIKKDAEAYFLASICLIFLGDQKSKDYLQLAYMADKVKTKILVNEFYIDFFKDNRFVNEKEKKALEDKIKRIM